MNRISLRLLLKIVMNTYNLDTFVFAFFLKTLIFRWFEDYLLLKSDFDPILLY